MLISKNVVLGLRRYSIWHSKEWDELEVIWVLLHWEFRKVLRGNKSSSLWKINIEGKKILLFVLLC